MFDRNSPIGVLDSGIGGFSVVRQVQRLLPSEDLLYFGDGANVPYGNHSEEQIVAMARYMFRFMEERRVKALLVACNTISCVVERCEDEVSCPTFNSVQAGADAAADAVVELGLERVGVISTVFTHNSGCYPQRILAHSPKGLTVLSRGCADLARLVEHNLGNQTGMAEIEENLRQELDTMVREEGIQCCVLGCTHYPLVEDSIRRLYPGLPLIDPAEQMALRLKDYLQREGLARTTGERGRLDIYTTGDVEEYGLRARQVGLGPAASVRQYPAMEL